MLVGVIEKVKNLTSTISLLKINERRLFYLAKLLLEKNKNNNVNLEIYS